MLRLPVLILLVQGADKHFPIIDTDIELRTLRTGPESLLGSRILTKADPGVMSPPTPARNRLLRIGLHQDALLEGQQAGVPRPWGLRGPGGAGRAGPQQEQAESPGR